MSRSIKLIPSKAPGLFTGIMVRVIFGDNHTFLAAGQAASAAARADGLQPFFFLFAKFPLFLRSSLLPRISEQKRTYEQTDSLFFDMLALTG
jgi:hypothetical protein